IFTCQRRSAPATADAVCSPIFICMWSPGSDQPHITFAFPRCRTMLSPKSGLTNGSGLAVASVAPWAEGLPLSGSRMPVAATRRRMNLKVMTLSPFHSTTPALCSAHEGPLLAPEIVSVIRVSLSRVLGVLGIRAQRPASSRKCLSGGDHRFRRNAFLDPVQHCAEHVELVECRTAAAVAHPRHQKHPTPFGHLVRTAVSSGKGPVVLERIQRRKPRIAVSMEKEDLAATRGKRRQVG